MIKHLKKLPLCLASGCAALFLFTLLLTSGAESHTRNFSPSESAEKPSRKLRCPETPEARLKKYMEAYRNLLKVMGTGEGGKMDTPRKQKAYEIYQFYEKCLEASGTVASDAAEKPDSGLKEVESAGIKTGIHNDMRGSPPSLTTK